MMTFFIHEGPLDNTIISFCAQERILYTCHYYWRNSTLESRFKMLFTPYTP